MSRTIYISGPMKGDPKYREKFAAAESYLLMKGWTVVNPAYLPKGLPAHSYMPICLAMVKACEAICMLEGSKLSQGARLECDFAGYQGKTIYFGLETVPVVEDEMEALDPLPTVEGEDA